MRFRLEDILRKDGVTKIVLGNIVIKTKLINRFRYNDLRKKEFVTFWDLKNALKKIKL